MDNMNITLDDIKFWNQIPKNMDDAKRFIICNEN